MAEQPSKILIVDDDISHLKVLKNLLNGEAELYLAKNGTKALEIAKKQQPTLILLDIMMAELTGFDVIEQLKNELLTSDIPVIFITGLNRMEDEEKAFKLGACDYIQKPFSACIVKARVKLHLQLEQQKQLLSEQANIDPLTQVANRRRFDEVFQKEWLAAYRDQNCLSVLMIDIDYFKPYNDLYGHQVGDEILTQISKTINKQFNRPRDLFARYGGEEFVAILPNTDGENAKRIMDTCCKLINQLEIEHKSSAMSNVLTISIGGFSGVVDQYFNAEKVLNLADDMLYQAKHNGRNQSVLFTPPVQRIEMSAI